MCQLSLGSNFFGSNFFGTSLPSNVNISFRQACRSIPVSLSLWKRIDRSVSTVEEDGEARLDSNDEKRGPTERRRRRVSGSGDIPHKSLTSAPVLPRYVHLVALDPPELQKSLTAYRTNYVNEIRDMLERTT